MRGRGLRVDSGEEEEVGLRSLREEEILGNEERKKVK